MSNKLGSTMTNTFGNLYQQEEKKQNNVIDALTHRVESLEFSNLSLTVQNIQFSNEIVELKHRLQLLELWVSKMDN